MYSSHSFAIPVIHFPGILYDSQQFTYLDGQIQSNDG